MKEFNISTAPAKKVATSDTDKVAYPYLSLNEWIMEWGKKIYENDDPLAARIIDVRQALLMDVIYNLRAGNDVIPIIGKYIPVLTDAANAWHAANPSKYGKVYQYNCILDDPSVSFLLGKEVYAIVIAVNEDDARRILARFDISDCTDIEIAAIIGENFWPNDKKQRFLMNIQVGDKTKPIYTTEEFLPPTWMNEKDPRMILCTQLLGWYNGNDAIMEMATAAFNKKMELRRAQNTPQKQEEEKRIYSSDYSDLIRYLQEEYTPSDAELKPYFSATESGLHTVQQLVDLQINRAIYDVLYSRTTLGELAYTSEKEAFRWLFANGLTFRVFDTLGKEPESIEDWVTILKESLGANLTGFLPEEVEAWKTWASMMLERISNIEKAHWWELKITTIKGAGTTTAFKGGVFMPDSVANGDPMKAAEFLYKEFIRSNKTYSDISKNSDKFKQEVAAQLLKNTTTQE